MFDSWEAEVYKKLYIKSECCSPNKKDCGHTQHLTETSVFFLNGSSGHKQQTSHLQNPTTLTKNLKPPTDSLVFQGTAMFGLLETATARFANSGEIMLFLGLVGVEFRLSVEP